VISRLLFNQLVRFAMVNRRGGKKGRGRPRKGVLCSPLACSSSDINEDSGEPDLIYEHAGEGISRVALPTHLEGQADDKLDGQADDDKHNSELDGMLHEKDVGHLDWGKSLLTRQGR
jgi:hypothetical protein